MAKMKLSRIPILTESVPVSEGVELEVRGVNLSDVVTLMHKHAPMMMIVYNKLRQNDGEVDSEELKKVIGEIAFEFPDLLAAVIALAANDYSEMGVAVARQLPLEVQVSALDAIFRMSFNSESSLEKLMLLAVKAMQGVRRAVETVRLPISEAGSGDSGATATS